MITTDFKRICVALSLRVFLLYDLKKSSNITADMEFNPVDNELNIVILELEIFM